MAPSEAVAATFSTYLHNTVPPNTVQKVNKCFAFLLAIHKKKPTRGRGYRAKTPQRNATFALPRVRAMLSTKHAILECTYTIPRQAFVCIRWSVFAQNASVYVLYVYQDKSGDQQLAHLKRGEVGTVDGRRKPRAMDQHLPQLCSPLGIHAASQPPHERVQQPPDGKPAQNVLKKARPIDTTTMTATYIQLAIARSACYDTSSYCSR